jgi:quercetin dioxygenase-like cupin family protein
MDVVVESAAPEHGVRRGWFGREQAPAGVALTFETELGYTFDPARPKRRDINMDATKGFVVPAGGGKHLDMAAPGRFAALKLVGHETNESIMLFEETVPVGTKSLFHLHRDSDEVAWVLAGEITFKIGDEVTVGGPGTCAFFPRNVPHAWKSTGRETGRVLFMYTPAAAGGYVEELLNHRPINDDERNQLRDRYHWEVVGPNPL